MYSIGIDIGGSHITCCMYGHTNKQIIEESLVNRKVNTFGSKDEIIDGWVSAISETISKTKVSYQGIGFAMPGPFDYYNGISLIKGVDKLESLYGLNLRKEIADRFNLEPQQVRFINDATAFSVAEASIGKASKYKRVVAITLGTGFGSSFLNETQPIVEGNMVPEGGVLYNKFYNGKLADEIFSTRGLVGSYKDVSGNVVKNVRELCDLINTNKKAAEVFELFGSKLGCYIKPYLEKFGAEVLVIGGNISKAYPYFSKHLQEIIPDIEIYVSNLGEKAAIIGGALLLDDAYYLQLEDTLKKM
ncbi:ROK family protein [Flavivirga sp. 57AJ16]|uniref:ROK family protein n=1 Tax=Flavivirga sp. 57AJ16 TaxID=3025307 RepID=UPI002366FD2E|nr:ROK family protein [Flavivirga sp. 57AJ16]MDD7884505.1 ROK family protein [Flavivirga sp. 57AJ16]